MVVMKFGGTSVGSRDRLKGMATLVRAHQGPLVVVVSAMGGTTDSLLDAGAAAANYVEMVSAVRHADKWVATLRCVDSGEEFTTTASTIATG